MKWLDKQTREIRIREMLQAQAAHITKSKALSVYILRRNADLRSAPQWALLTSERSLLMNRQMATLDDLAY